MSQLRNDIGDHESGIYNSDSNSCLLYLHKTLPLESCDNN